MSNLFKQVVSRKPKCNVFNLSHERKFSMDMAKLVPILCEEVVPGDKWKCNTEVLLRYAPMLAPIMHRVNVYTHYFFVPNRLVWNEWEDFITGGPDGTSIPAMPQINLGDTTFGHGSLPDYLGCATQNTIYENDYIVNALPFRAYQTIYNEYYRDENLSPEIEFDLGSGLVDIQDRTALCLLRDRAWEKDYFTSALPFTQKGEEITIPVGGKAPVYVDDDIFPADGSQPVRILSSSGDPNQVAEQPMAGEQGTGDLVREGTSNNLYIDLNSTNVADLSEASGVTINELRRASALQRWLERNARGGSRYIEQILSHFGVRSSDARLQRPEYLGGGKTPVVISEVLQTSQSDISGPDQSAQGNMAGHGVSAGGNHAFRKYFEEHGLIIGIMSVIPKTAYGQGSRKIHLKDDKYDFFWPDLAHLGEQQIDQKELYVDFTQDMKPEDEELFGYTPRYAEYKTIPSTYHGDFKEDLEFWHMGVKYDNPPSLNDTFVKPQQDDLNRIFPDVEGLNYQKLYVQVFNEIKARRPMPRFGTPRLM